MQIRLVERGCHPSEHFLLIHSPTSVIVQGMQAAELISDSFARKGNHLFKI